MDPVTHGLVGAAAGLSILEHGGKDREVRPARKTRWVAALCGALAGELPDADRVIDQGFELFGSEGQGLSYMLYHRGPSHSLVACLVAAPLLALLARALARRVSPPLWQLLLIAGTGLLLHLAMDGMNDYGIHPFPPLSQRWFYGDFLFLAEPTLWAALLPYVLLMLGVGTRQLLPVCALVGGVIFAALVLLKEWLMPFGAVVALGCLVVQALLQRRGPRPIIAWASVTLVLLTFFVASRVARAQALAWTAKLAPGQHVSQVVTTPAPANPLCWRVITVTRDGDAFVARMGVISFGELVDATTCYSPPLGIIPSSVCGLARCRPALAGVHQFAEFSATFSEFERMAQTNPRVGATRHFLRVPFWGRDARFNACDAQEGPEQDVGSICSKQRVSSARPARPNSNTLLIGDLRVDYDKDDVGEFCKYSFPRGARESYDARLPVGDPPFFPRSPAATSSD